MSSKMKLSRSLSFLSSKSKGTAKSTLLHSHSTSRDLENDNTHSFSDGKSNAIMADEQEGVKNGSETDQNAMETRLLESIGKANEATALMFSNRAEDAMAKLRPGAKSEIYYALGYGILHTVQALMSFESADIELALEVLKQSEEVCNRKRHKTTMTNNMVTKMVVRPNYNNYTEEECHAELCYAECLLFRAIVTFLQEDNFVSFIKGGFWVRSCFQTYKACADMLQHRKWNNKIIKDNFRSGVCLAIGTFNLMISALPSRVLKLLEFVGFSGNRDLGIEKLDEGSKLSNTVRGVYCSLIILVFNTVLAFALGPGSKEFIYLDDKINPLIKQYPKSTLIQFLAGRYENCKGNIEGAIEHLETSLKLEIDWKKFRHFSHWEITWCFMLKRKWREGIPHIEVLIEENKWSRATYSFIKAALTLMSDDITEQEKTEVLKIMKKVPDLRLHIAGKSIPLEKFWCKKAVKYVEQNNYLLYPAYEMLYVWNYFLFLKGRNDILSQIIGQMERAIEDLNKRKDWEYYGDNYCLALFIKGLCLKYMSSPLSAEEIFKEVILKQKMLKDDLHLSACASLELGLICTETGNYPIALQCFEAARGEKAFFLEFRTHYGINEATRLMKLKQPVKSVTAPVNSSYKFYCEGEQNGRNDTHF